MGRWSRRIAPLFLDWLAAPAGLDWLEVGCGTGALSAAILGRCTPRRLVAVDPSENFLVQARRNVPDPRAVFERGDAQALPCEDGSFDRVVSGLVLNFVPDRERALGEMRRAARPGARIAFYVWDYPGGGIAFMRAFWTAAVALDPGAAALTEDKRFPFCTREGVAALAEAAGLAEVETTGLEADTVFADFADFWTPFTLGAGPAPGYCASLPPEARERLRDRLEATLPREADGSIRLTARAWAVKGRAP
jgi:ubiquinone/menaquinone biosynthesis C-methylase UbiE